MRQVKQTEKTMIETVINDYQIKINSRLDILSALSGQHYDIVSKAVRHSLLSGGKRIRPIILLEFYKLFGGDDDCAYNFACAVEMIHTYSLIHDDLPCMDNDDMRRGKPACHKEFGEDIALLAGDSLLTDAFGVASKTLGISPERIVKAIIYLSLCAGTSGMVGGQVIDLKNSNSSDYNIIYQMYSLKTSGLIKASAVCGAILAGADDEQIKLCEKFGENLGIAFQIIDDFLDLNSTDEELGKPTGSDEKNNKKTLIGVLGAEKARKLAEDLTAEAESVLDMINPDCETLKDLTSYLLRRKF